MSNGNLPERPSFELVAEFFRACKAGDLDVLHAMLHDEASLVRERTPDGSTCLHLSVRHPEALRLLIARGADPNARDVEDNASPLHFAAADGRVDSVRALLDAGADVHGTGDLHGGGVIGWAARKGNESVVNLLLERGAHHHIFSAMAMGDLALVQKIVESDPGALARRRSRFENEQTPLHAAFAPPDGLGYLTGTPNHAMVELLIALGADLEAKDNRGRTPLAVAILRGDVEATRLLKAAGAATPEDGPMADRPDLIATLSGSVKKGDPMFSVADMRATVSWYESIGFTVIDRYEDHGELTFAKLSFGRCEFGLSPGGNPGPRDVSLWFYTDRIQDLYELFKAQRVAFDEDLYVPFYGGHQFSIRDINGLSLIFWQPDWLL
jgi:ankyrin repeat protein/catechol 2,3-dioxygenase-like lactoylglutathione lyase family enzyme